MTKKDNTVLETLLNHKSIRRYKKEVPIGETIETIVRAGQQASPVPIASFTMAKEMDADAELAGQIVIATSAVSILTIFVWIYLLKRVDLI